MIGLADPQALVICNAAKDAYDFLGSPEGELAIAQVPRHRTKSNAAYTAFGAAMRTAKEGGSLLPPKHILNSPTKLMKSEGYRRRTNTTTTRRKPFPDGVLPGRAGAPDFLTHPIRIRARDQETSGLLGKAAARTDKPIRTLGWKLISGQKELRIKIEWRKSKPIPVLLG